MYDLNRPGVLPLNIFANQLFVSYCPFQIKINSCQRKYHQENNKELLYKITQQLNLFYKSLWNVKSDYQQQYARLVMLFNLKQHVSYDADKQGLSLQHKMLYIIFTYFQGLIRTEKIDWKLLQTIFSLTNEDKMLEQIPQSIKLLLDFQYQKLISYLQSIYLNNTQQKQRQKLQFLIQLIDKKMLQKHVETDHSSELIKFSKIQEDHKKMFATSILKNKKSSNNKNQNHQWSFSSKSRSQIEILCGILTSNRQIIQEVCRGNWSLYLHFYLAFLDNQKHQGAQIIQIAYDYLKKYSKNYNFKLTIVQQYCLNLVARMPLIETYELGFHIMSSFTNNLVVHQAFDMNVSKLQILINSPEFYSNLQNNLLQNASNISWKIMLNIICIINFSSEPLSNQCVESLLDKQLPYEISRSQQIFIIQQKLKDLKKIGLQFLAKKYLSSLFQFYLGRSKKLSAVLMHIFILNIQSGDNSRKSKVFRQMKAFLMTYFKYFDLNFQLLEVLQDLIQRQERIFDEKIIYKIQQMFSVMYKNKQINQECQSQSRVNILDKLLSSKSVKCLQTLKTIHNILKQLENAEYLKIKNDVQNLRQKKFKRGLQIKIIDYLKLWQENYPTQADQDLFEEDVRVKKLIKRIKNMIF